jgi:hypothetical protein
VYQVLVRLIVLSAFLQLGLSLSRIEKCHSRMCWDEIQRASRKILEIDWRPISVFPEEAKKLQRQQKTPSSTRNAKRDT